VCRDPAAQRRVPAGSQGTPDVGAPPRSLRRLRDRPGPHCGRGVKAATIEAPIRVGRCGRPERTAAAPACATGQGRATRLQAMIKYLGSKRRLVPFLGALLDAAGAATALDLFTGTTRVAQEWKRRGAEVWAVDLARYAHVLA